MIPIYRAKKIDSDEYVEGYYIPLYITQDGEIWDDENYHYILNKAYIDFEKENHWWTKDKIDPTTLAIHFPDMIDSQGNKIFASLQEDGKGGDIVNHQQCDGGILESFGPEKCLVKYMDHLFAPFFINARYKNQKTYMTKQHLTIIGIQQ